MGFKLVVIINCNYKYLKLFFADLIKTLPIKIQVSLLEDLLYFTNNHVPVEIPNVRPCNVDAASEHYLFALLLYHRWVIKTSMPGLLVNGSGRLNRYLL